MKLKLSLPLCITAGLAVITLLVRAAVLPLIGSLFVRYIVTYLCLGAWIAAAVLIRRIDHNLEARPVEGRSARPVGVAALAAGAVTVSTAARDAVTYLLSGKLPAPSVMATNTIDFVLAIGGVVTGLAAGVYLVVLGLRWMRSAEEDPTAGSALPLLLTAWLWMRLSRYVLSYAMGVHFSESVFEFVMLASVMLFSYLFARRAQIRDKHASGDGWLQALASLSAAGLISAPLTSWVLTLLNKDSGHVSIAGTQDLLLGIFVLALLWYWHVNPVSDEQEVRTRLSRKNGSPLAALQTSDGDA